MRLWPRIEPERSQTLSFYEGTLAVIFISWSTGVIFTGYALWLGASPAVLAALGAMPLLAQMAAPIALFWRGSRRRMSAILSAAGRGMFALVLFLPLLPSEWRIPGLIAVAALTQLTLAPVGVLWTSWMADLVPEAKRGRYFGLRNSFLGLVGTLGNLVAGVVVDALPKPWGFLVVLGVGVGFGVSAVLLLRRQHEPERPASPEPLANLRLAWQDRPFRRFLRYVALWHFAIMIGAPFVFALFLEYAQMGFAQVGLWTVLSASCGLLFGTMWGRIADRVGHQRVLLWTTGLASLLPLLWLLGAPGRLWPLWISAVTDALAWSGLNTALTNSALQQAPAERRGGYLAWMAVAAAVGGLLGSSLGGFIGSLHLGPSPYHLPILVSLIMRLAATYYLSRSFRHPVKT